MINANNFSPRQLAAIAAIILSVSISIGVWWLQRNLEDAALFFLAIFCGSYLLIFYFIQNFIYRKIKLIYKFIYQTKASKKQEMYYKHILPQKTIDEVEEDVEAWGAQQQQEIEILKRNESFRKDFLQNLSHEFKTPVFAIQGYVDTLLQGALENPEVNRKFLEKASKNVERLAHLIQDLDEISKLERGELKIDKQNFIIQDLFWEVVETLSLKAEQNGIAAHIKKGCEQSLTVHADKEKIRQVLTNLIDNAIKYSKRGGTITASMYHTDGNAILIEITDDGIGIPERHLTRIFERFFRTDEGRSRQAGGSGLGLAICKHIIEAHGHSIHVRSTQNVGTTVGFTLDARRD
ncbi:MAG: ATP-binding protein [Chitinophagaceae bacterium]